MNQSGNKKKKIDQVVDMYETQDVVVKTSRGTSLITQEMRAQGMNLTQNMLRELQRRNLGEIKTTELVKMIIQMMGYFIPRPQAGANDSVIDVTGNAGVKEILKQLNMKN